MPALQNIQKHGKVLIAVVALALFAFIAEEGFRAMEQNSNANRNKVGEIDGEAISASDFEKLVDEYTEAMKFVQQRSSFTDEETTQIKDQVWQMLVNNKLVENECKKLGLTVTDEELQNIINEGNSPLLSQTPFIGQNGRFDKDMLKKFLADYEKTKTQNPQMAEQYAQVYKFWTFIEKMLRTQTLQMKYQALISNALISNPISAKASFENRTNQSDILMAAVPYATINDNDVKIEEADYKAAYEKNKERFKNFAESRDIKYIDVLVKASPADRASLEEEMKEYVTKLANGEDATNVVRLSNSLVPYSDVFVSKHVLPGDIAGKIDSTAVGTVASTFYNAQDNTLNCYRYIAKASIPDSVEYQSIMVMGASKDEIKTKTDSVVNAINAGGDIKAIAKNYNQTGESSWLTSRQYEGQKLSTENVKYINAVTTLGVGSTTVVETAQGNVVVKVLNRKAFSDKYKVAAIKREVTFSKETYSKAFNNFSQFVAKNKTLKEIEANASKSGYTVLDRSDIYSSEHNVCGVGNTREIMRWLFNDAKKNDVSKLYECGTDNDHMMLIAVTGVNEAGYLPLEKVKPMLKNEILNDKKAEKIIASLGNVKSVADAKKQKGAVSDTIKHVTFSAPAFVMATSSSEPALSARVSMTAKGQFAGPVKGNAGVFVFQVLDKQKAQEKFDAKTEEGMLTNMAARAASRFINDLYIKAKVVDKRYMFF
ncbi:MAG: SurA N-terminal domain-containing protein [Bacteroidaceae bacterium]|nr:SurA N-terminal domain-containing protein [Bacteroidaceae bacterium]MBQ5477769.1 SurA N-terminal domain-containing protein [Bacteroidaceae bacterium]MCR4701910.1 SurA N-terminal domain-containing protein [Bacteroidaceae bacterium]